MRAERLYQGAMNSTGATDSGSLLTDSGSITQTGSTDTGSTSGTGEILSFSGETSSGSTDSGTYMVIAGYIASSLSGATPITLTTTLTHIYLGDEKIATFQSQTDDTPKTSDDDQFIFHISDHLNSSSLDLSSTGVVLQATDYQPFGKTITYQVTNQRVKGKKGGYKNKYLFANKQQDNETDLQYFEKRYYDNRIGRFTTEDLVFWEVGSTLRPAVYFSDPQQWNSYSYTRNNPINLVDPTGEAAALLLVLTPEAQTLILGAGLAIAGWTITQGEKLGNFLEASVNALSNITSTTTTSDKTAPNNNQNAQSQAGQETTGQGQTVPNSEVQVGTASPPPNWGGGGNKNGKNGKQNSSTNNNSVVNTKFGNMNISDHAITRMQERGITKNMIQSTVNKGEAFTYRMNGQTLQGFYDAANKVFVGKGDSITTVIKNVSRNYINNLKATIGKK